MGHSTLPKVMLFPFNTIVLLSPKLLILSISSGVPFGSGSFKVKRRSGLQCLANTNKARPSGHLNSLEKDESLVRYYFSKLLIYFIFTECYYICHRLLEASYRDDHLLVPRLLLWYDYCRFQA